MGTMQDQMEKVGFKLSDEEKKKVKNSLKSIKRRTKTTVCRKCGEEIKFAPDTDGKIIPHDLDNNPHWQSCAYSSFTHKKASMGIMKKLAVLFLLKLGTDLEAEAGLTKKEVKILHAALEKAFKDSEEVDKTPVEAGGQEVKGEVQFKPEPCDSVGDPDEDRAPDEVLVHEFEEKMSKESDLDKGVEKVISEPINATVEIPEGTPVCAQGVPEGTPVAG